jgi:fumarate hydratase subunit beta
MKKKPKINNTNQDFIKLTPPLTEEVVKNLKAGNKVLISGKIYTARDSAHKAFGHKPSFKLEGAVLYYASPTPARPGHIIGSIGPTTASRMDSFLEPLLKQGLKATIGKGSRSAKAISLLQKYRAVYLLVPGGTAASLSKHIKKSKLIAYPELGAEAVLELEVVDFPALVAIDSQGNNLFEEGRKKYERK